MGMLISVYRRADDTDCSLNGISNRHTRLCVVNVDGPFKPDIDAPAVRLDQHTKGCLCLVPVIPAGAGWQLAPGDAMMGGNYGGTSDSRFCEKCEIILGHRFYGLVAIHDRFE
jgi:hypothetical protein